MQNYTQQARNLEGATKDELLKQYERDVEFQLARLYKFILKP